MSGIYVDVVADKIKATGLSVREFAMRKGLAPASLAAWLRGTRNAKFSNACSLARALGCRVEDISDYQFPVLENADTPDVLAELYCDCAKNKDISGLKILKEKTLEYARSVNAPYEAITGSDLVPVLPSRFRPVPVISFAQAAGYEPALEPLCDYLRETSDREHFFMDVKDGYFALEVSGDSMAPDYPDGSIVLVATDQFPQRGDIVVAKFSDGQVVLKEYHRKSNVITLSSINPEGQNFEWHCKEQPGYVQWMWPVIEASFKPRARRWAQARGIGR